MTKFFRIVVVIICLTGVIVFLRIDRHNIPSEQAMEPLSPVAIHRMQSDFRSRVQAVGFDAAYTEIEKKYPRGPLVGHAADHYVGEYLFEKYGMKGLSYCRNRFVNGCVHEIINKMFAQKGISAQGEALAACNGLEAKKRGGCIHGLGHSLLEYMGRKDLADVLQRCLIIDGVINTHGCIAGAFMEYFFPSVYTLSENNFQVLPFDPDHPYDQCLELPPEFQSICVYGLVEWWDVVFDHKDESILPLCKGLSDTILRKTCFGAIGSTIMFRMSYAVSPVLNICDQADGINERAWCRAGAGSILEVNGKTKNKSAADVVCDRRNMSVFQICEESLRQFILSY